MSLSFSPDGRRLAWTSSDGSVKVRDVRTNRDVQTFRGHLAAAISVAFSPDGRSLAAGGADHLIRVWDATEEGEATWRVEPNVNTHICELMFESDGKLIAVGGLGGSARIWDVLNKKTLTSLPMPAAPIATAARSRDGRYFAWVADDNQLHVVDLPADRIVCERAVGPGPVTALTFSFDSRQFAWGGADGLVRICDADNGNDISTLGPVPHGITGVAFHPDGRQLVSVARDATFALWDLGTREQIAQFGRTERDEERLLPPEPEPAKSSVVGVTRLSYSPDGSRLAATYVRRPLEIWDMKTRRVALTLDWDGMSVQTAGWSSDGRRLAIARSAYVRVLDATELTRPARRRQAADRALAWHRSQGLQSLSQRQGYAARFHFDRLVDAEPMVAAHHEGLARALAELAQWQTAFAECTKAVELGDVKPITWYNQAVLALQVGNAATYRQICTRLLERHEFTTDIELANTMAWTCLLAPAALENPYRVIPLARRAADKQRKEYAYQNTLATAIYRAGHPKEAIGEFAKAILLHDLKQGNAYDWVYLAMAHADLGDAIKAREWLDKATAAPAQLDWQSRVEMRLLLAEAKKRLDQAKPRS